MSYTNLVKSFEDYQGRSINLSEESWEHIKEFHKEISLEMIEKTLKDPLEVRQSSSQYSSLLYYSFCQKSEDKTKFYCVVVKITKLNEFFIKTATTTSALKKGNTVFKKVEE